jgi:hypothetical protein
MMKIKTKHQLKTHEVLRVHAREGVEFYKVPVKRHEHKPKGRFDIDLHLLNEIATKADPGFDNNAYFIKGGGVVVIRYTQFKYRDFFNLITIFRQQGVINVSDGDLYSINHEYRLRYETL